MTSPRRKAEIYAVSPGWRNMIDATLPSPFITDLAQAVTNDGDEDGAARFLLSLTSDFLRTHGQDDGPIAAYDFAVYDIEAIGDAWPVVHRAVAEIGADPSIAVALARFIADRLPVVWGGPPFQRHAPVTRAVVLAERTHDLVALFSAGLRPNGSKDPYALRRAAKHWLYQVVFPVTVGRRVKGPPQ
jgi:hypothetical protein